MSAINIDLIYGNRYYKPKVEQKAGPKNASLQPALRRDCPSDASEQISHEDGTCGLKSESLQALPL